MYKSYGVTSIVTIILLSANVSFADIHTATSCAYGDVSAAVTAASSGDTVSVPAGSCDWGTNTIFMSKAIKINGNNTTLNGAHTAYGFFAISNSSSESFPFDISGFNFVTTGTYIMHIAGAGYNWRIHGNSFYKSTPSGILSFAMINAGGSHTLFGLIDNNSFTNVKIDIVGTSMSSADSSWKAAAQWGTNQAIFVENNIFRRNVGTSTANAIDSNGGARMVIRYNTFNDARVEAHSACETSVRGTRSYEVYNNIFNYTGSNWEPPLRLRGGSHVVTGNTVSGNWSPSSVTLDNRRSSFDSSCASGFGNSDGTSIYDTNLLNSASGRVDGYLALDQPGAGTGPIGAQTSDPIYIWGNTSGKICLGGTNQYASCTSNSDCPSSTCSTKVTTPNNVYLHNNINNQPYHIVSGRDYFENTARPGYTKYTCPHPLAGSGSCDSTVAGRAGYAITEPSVTVPAPNPVATYAVTVSKNGSGTVTSSPLGIDCESTCSYSFTSGTSVTLTAVADTGYSFGSWSGACTGTNATCTLTMDAAKSVTATFIQNTYPLTVTKAATNTGTGIVTSADSGITCGSDCSESYTYGTIVTLSAAADSGSAFYGWSGACTGTTSTCQVTMDAAKNVIASFLAQGSPALTTSKKGTGNGKIRSISAVLASNIAASNAIDCGDVCVAQYDNATKVTLTAEPEAGSTFSGWEGACSGTGDCVVTVNSLTSVVATFSLQASGGSPTTMLSVSGDGGGGGGGCFIATAAFGSYLDPHVMALREFRDKVLMNYELGRAFVRFYYKYSPAIANIISQNDILTFVTRLGLTPFIYAVAYPLATAAALLSLILVLLAIRRKKTAKPARMMANVYFQKQPRRGLVRVR